MMTSLEMEPWFQEFDKFCEDQINKQQQQMKACRTITELENKLALEVKIKKELTQQLEELTRRDGELERVCASIESLTIADSDQTRLEKAKEIYQVAKELTGIRLDFSAPENIAKGFIKNKNRRWLLPFSIEIDSDALWELIRSTSDTM